VLIAQCYLSPLAGNFVATHSLNTTDTTSWREAVILAVKEIRRLGLYGLTQSELRRYKQASLGEVMQTAAQSEQMGHEDIISKFFIICAFCSLCALRCVTWHVVDDLLPHYPHPHQPAWSTFVLSCIVCIIVKLLNQSFASSQLRL
jgi:hypothetical protein